MKAIKLYYISHWLYKHKIPLLPKLFQLIIYIFFNCWIPCECEIGRGTKLGYGGIAIVIHKDAKIGKNCIIGTCVTIGGNKANDSVPVIEDSCYIASGAKIFGTVTIGKESFIGANSVVTRDVPPKSLVSGIPGKVIKKNININDYSTHIKIDDKETKVK